MTPVTFNSQSAFLLDSGPYQWPLDITFALPSHVETGATARETRLPLGDTLRIKMSFVALLQGSKVNELRNSLQSYSTQPVLCPLWAYPFDAGATPQVTASFYVLMGDGAAAAIQPHASLPFSRPAFPLLVGRLANAADIEPSLQSSDLAVVDFEFVESDQYAIALPSYSPPTGPAVPAGARPIFNFRHNWASPPKAGGASVPVDRKRIGQGRGEASAYYSQPARRGFEVSSTLSGMEPWQLLRLFLDSGGQSASVWVSGEVRESTLTADVASGDSALTVSAVTDRGANGFVMLDDQSNRKIVTVTGNSGSQWTLSGTVGQAFRLSNTRISSAVLARFDAPEITLTFEDIGLARSVLKFTEVPWELATVSGETSGTTIAGRPTSAYLYEFSSTFPSGTQYWRFTDFERNLSDGSNTFTGNPVAFFEHGDIKETADLQRQSVQIRSRHYSGNPLSLLIPMQLEYPLALTIWEVDVSGSTASNLRAVFSGEVQRVDMDGPSLRATALSMSSVMDRKIPRQLVQPGCNWTLFETKCGLLESDWKWQGVVGSWNATTRELYITSVSRVTGSAVTLTAGFFAGGYLYLGSGTALQNRGVSDSQAASGSTIVLVVSQPFPTAPTVGATVYFHPGCDGLYTTCNAKFSNRANFGGFPFMAVGNPSMLKVSKAVSSGGKK